MARIDDILSGASLVSKSVGQPHQLMDLIYSDPGAGKTALAVELAQEVRGNGKILHLDSHEGFVTLQEKRWEHIRSNVVRKRIDNPSDLAALGDAFLANHPKIRPFSVVVFDELSAWVKTIAIDYVRQKNNVGVGDLIPAIEGSDWNPIGYIVADILGRFQRSGVHMVINAHSREKGDRDGGGTKKYSPNFTPLMNIDIQGMLHNVTLLTKTLAGRNQYERTLYTSPSASVVAKTRVEGMPSNPTRKQFIELTGAWVRGEVESQPVVKSADVVTGKSKPERVTLPKDVPLPEDETDDDQPVIVDDTTTQQ